MASNGMDVDVEKSAVVAATTPVTTAITTTVSSCEGSPGVSEAAEMSAVYSSEKNSTLPPSSSSWLQRLKMFNDRIEGLSGFEARGISRVMPDEREQPSLWDDISVTLLWFSANISLNNLAVGLFGPTLFSLGFLDSAMCAIFGALLGSISTAYMSTWGPQSGNRTMVSSNFQRAPPPPQQESPPLIRVF